VAERAFGDGDATFQALGRESGIRGLVESFYRIMDSAQEAEQIRLVIAEQARQPVTGRAKR